MPEKELKPEDVLTFSEGSKDPRLCRVKFCRTKRMRDRCICSKHNMQLWRARNPTRSAFEVIKARARKTKVSFTLTFEDFKEIADATGYIESKGNHAHQLHLDRVDARKGYDLGNIRVITCSENSKKGSYERRIQLGSGKWVMLHEIGIGVPRDISEEDINENTMGEVDWDSGYVDTSTLPEDHPDWTPF